MNALVEKYVNPLTDFGFKKLFGSEPNKDLLIDFLNQMTPGEREAYEESLKFYRDMKNVVDTSKEEGRDERTIEIAKNLKETGIEIEVIMNATGLSKAEIEDL